MTDVNLPRRKESVDSTSQQTQDNLCMEMISSREAAEQANLTDSPKKTASSSSSTTIQTADIRNVESTNRLPSESFRPFSSYFAAELACSRSTRQHGQLHTSTEMKCPYLEPQLQSLHHSPQDRQTQLPSDLTHESRQPQQSNDTCFIIHNSCCSLDSDRAVSRSVHERSAPKMIAQNFESTSRQMLSLPVTTKDIKYSQKSLVGKYVSLTKDTRNNLEISQILLGEDVEVPVVPNLDVVTLYGLGKNDASSNTPYDATSSVVLKEKPQHENKIKKYEISYAQEDEISCPQENKISRPQEDEISSPQENDISSPQENKISYPQENEISSPQKIEISCPQRGGISYPKENEILYPKENKISYPQENEISSSQRDEISYQQENEILFPKENEISYPKENEISYPKEIEILSLQEDELSYPQEDELSYPQEDELSYPQEDELSYPQEDELLYLQEDEKSNHQNRVAPPTGTRTTHKLLEQLSCSSSHISPSAHPPEHGVIHFGHHLLYTHFDSNDAHGPVALTKRDTSLIYQPENLELVPYKTFWGQGYVVSEQSPVCTNLCNTKETFSSRLNYSGLIKTGSSENSSTNSTNEMCTTESNVFNSPNTHFKCTCGQDLWTFSGATDKEQYMCHLDYSNKTYGQCKARPFAVDYPPIENSIMRQNYNTCHRLVQLSQSEGSSDPVANKNDTNTEMNSLWEVNRYVTAEALPDEGTCLETEHQNSSEALTCSRRCSLRNSVRSSTDSRHKDRSMHYLDTSELSLLTSSQETSHCGRQSGREVPDYMYLCVIASVLNPVVGLAAFLCNYQARKNYRLNKHSKANNYYFAAITLSTVAIFLTLVCAVLLIARGVVAQSGKSGLQTSPPVVTQSCNEWFVQYDESLMAFFDMDHRLYCKVTKNGKLMEALKRFWVEAYFSRKNAAEPKYGIGNANSTSTGNSPGGDETDGGTGVYQQGDSVDINVSPVFTDLVSSSPEQEPALRPDKTSAVSSTLLKQSQQNSAAYNTVLSSSDEPFVPPGLQGEYERYLKGDTSSEVEDLDSVFLNFPLVANVSETQY